MRFKTGTIESDSHDNLKEGLLRVENQLRQYMQMRLDEENKVSSAIFEQKIVSLVERYDKLGKTSRSIQERVLGQRTYLEEFAEKLKDLDKLEDIQTGSDKDVSKLKAEQELLFEEIGRVQMKFQE